MPSQQRVDDLVEQMEADDEFAAAMELDAISTLRDTGFDDLAVTAGQERDRIGELVDRIYRDDVFRLAVEQDPTGELGSWGVPELAIGPVLMMAGAPDEVLERATADVEAHLGGGKPATIAAAAAMLGALAFAQQASAGSKPAAQAQVRPAALTQVAPAVQAQVAPADRAQVTRAARVSAQAQTAQIRWQGIQPNRFKAQGRFALLLRAHGTGL